MLFYVEVKRWSQERIDEVRGRIQNEVMSKKGIIYRESFRTIAQATARGFLFWGDQPLKVEIAGCALHSSVEYTVEYTM